MSIIDKLKRIFGTASDNGGSDMISCHDALRLVHEFLDGELESFSASQVQSHFDMCERCYPHLHLETVFREALRGAAAGEAAPTELRAKVSALLTEAESEG